MSNKYTVTFTPTENYFFGTENKHTNGTDNYFLHSSYLPQQTTLLGTLRYFLLLNAKPEIFNDNKIQDSDEAAKLIGVKSFNIDDLEFDFKAIKSISEVFLIEEKATEKTKFIIAPFWLDTENQMEFNIDLNCAILPSYNAKNHYPKQFTNGTKELNETDIFEEFIQTNNQKAEKEDAFFKTQSYRIKKGFCFAIDIELDVELDITKTTFMKMGGENKLFKINVFKTVDLKLKTSAVILKKYTNSTYTKLTLNSDTYIPNYEHKSNLFAYTKTKEFRNLKINTNKNSKYNNRSKEADGNSLQQSILFQLFESGSTFYFKTTEDANTFSKLLKNDNLQKAGFNQYTILNSKS